MSTTAPFRQRDPEALAIDGLLSLIEREVERHVRPLEETIQKLLDGQSSQVKSEAQEYLDIDALSERIHTPPDTIRDWLRKKKTNKIPVIKIPTGGLRFPWNEFEAWMRGQVS